jgi:IclR family transcriptional regulator, KDG regulon repressor
MIQVVDRALDILEYLAVHEGRGLSLKEISNHMSLNQGTCANIIKSLATRRYVEHIGPKKGFRLGPMAFFLIGNLSLRPQLIMVAKEIVENLSKDLNENCVLSVINRDKRILLYSTTVDHNLNANNKLERNIYETASGRLLLAYIPLEELNELIASHPLPSKQLWKEAQTKKKILTELKSIRANNIVITRNANHIIGVAVPIFKNQLPIASLSTYLPVSRCPNDVAKNIEIKLRAAAQDISNRLNQP